MESEALKSPSVSTRLAVDRTRLAHERTLMAWVRTATSLISFGFTIYKFFQYLREQGGDEHDRQLFNPRRYALLMIGIGLVSLVLATLQHRRNMKTLREHYANLPYSEALLLAALISIAGIMAFIAVVFRQ
jgi:inner membrane protein YidH